MAKKSQVVEASRPHGFPVRDYHRCSRCGRRRAYMRRFKMCRICVRELALKGEIPGVVKSSW